MGGLGPHDPAGDAAAYRSLTGMLRIGLTGGIGSGKSTVAAHLTGRGAYVVDADKVAREVVVPGTPALRQIVARFGRTVLTGGGELNRPALGRVVFEDPSALRDLEAITHPAIWARTAELFARAPESAVAVHDMPLLVEKEMAADYHLTIVVGASEGTRLRRLVRDRGMPEADARARIAAQATDAQRRTAADVWLDNEGTTDALVAQVDDLWERRLVPFEHNLRHGIRERRPAGVVLRCDPAWLATGARITARIRNALGEWGVRVDHIGSTAVTGLLAKDVIDVQVGVRQLSDADDPGFVGALAAAGYPRVEGIHGDNPKDGSLWPKRFHGGCDPGRIVHVHVRETGSPGWVWALRFRDWMRADAAARAEYAALKESIVANPSGWDDYPERKEPWFDAIHERVHAWAEQTRWSPH